MDTMFDGIRAPSTLGTFLRGKSWGGVRQIGKLNRRMLAALAAHTPLLPGAGVLAFIDVDSMAAPDLRVSQTGVRVRPHENPR
jgi:hypothetical protein